MSDDTTGRREYLQSVGAASAVAVAGCSGRELGVGSGEPARYSDFLVSEAVDENGVGVFSVDWNGIGTLQEESEGPTPQTPTPTPGDGDDTPIASDALAVYPVGVLFGVGLTTGVVANLLGFGRLVETDGPTDRIHVVNGALVFEGSYDTAEIDDALADRGTEQPTDYEGVPLYEAGGLGTAFTAAVSEELVVLVTAEEAVADTAAVTRRILDGEAGRIDRYRDDESDFGRLVSQFDAGLIDSAVYTPGEDVREAEATDEENDPASSASRIDVAGTIVGAASSATLSDAAYRSRLALLFADEEVPARTDVEAELGTAADEREVTVDGRLVVASATYRQPPDDDAPLV